MFAVVLSTSTASPSALVGCTLSWMAGGVEWVDPGMTAGSCRATSHDGADWVSSDPLSAAWSFYPSDNCTGDPVALGNGFRRFSPPGEPLHFGSVRMDVCP
ncbi:hypothetical protein BG418_33905 [Streptomyces sp. CBMA152]|nr:hypothetical protein [Streptomyces sp. CBMA152]